MTTPVFRDPEPGGGASPITDVEVVLGFGAAIPEGWTWCTAASRARGAFEAFGEHRLVEDTSLDGEGDASWRYASTPCDRLDISKAEQARRALIVVAPGSLGRA